MEKNISTRQRLFDVSVRLPSSINLIGSNTFPNLVSPCSTKSHIRGSCSNPPRKSACFVCRLCGTFASSVKSKAFNSVKKNRKKLTYRIYSCYLFLIIHRSKCITFRPVVSKISTNLIRFFLQTTWIEFDVIHFYNMFLYFIYSKHCTSRATYLCKGKHLEHWQNYLIHKGLDESEDSEKIRANALTCFYYLSSFKTIEEMCHMTHDEFL